MYATSERWRAGGLAAGVAAVLAVIGLVGVVATSCADDGQVVEIVVPRGTQERLDAGEVVAVMPSELRLAVGDVQRIRNEDVADQAVGPYFVAAGEQFELRYGEPGRYEGYCPLSEDGRYRIVITG